MRIEANLALLFWLAAALPAAETGDFDGDGRLSIADLVHHRDGLPAVPGSLAGLVAHPCHGSTFSWERETERSIVYLEELRRSVPGSLPHWLGVWDPAASPRQEPLPADPRVTVRLELTVAPGGENDRARIRMVLATTEPVRAVSLILESAGNVLRVPIFHPQKAAYPYLEYKWNAVTSGDGLFQHLTGDRHLIVHPATFLITGGKLVAFFLDGTIHHQLVGPGEMPFEIEARLPRGTPAGRYEVRLLPGSEILLADGTLLAPTFAGPTEVMVERNVEAGWDEGLPPVNLDPVTRRVLGKVEMRLAGGDGRVPEPGEPVAAGLPGDLVRVRVQLRTEVPLNAFSVNLRAPGGALFCGGEPDPRWTNPEDRRLYTAVNKGSSDCTNGVIGLDFRVNVDFSMSGGKLSQVPNALFPDRALEYFKPLGEWVDALEIPIRIPAEAAGGSDIPLVFTTHDPSSGVLRDMPATFSPYSVLFPCDQESDKKDDRPDNWSYEVSRTDGTVRVLGEQVPPDEPPPDAGVRFELGAVSGRPGDLVEVPISAASREPLSLLRLVLEVDPEVLEPENLELEIFSLLTGERVLRELLPGSDLLFQECDDPTLPREEQKCDFGVPTYCLWRETDPRFIFLDLIGVPDYPGPELREIARLRLRIPEGLTAAESVVRPARMTWKSGSQFDAEVESGGFLGFFAQAFSPARESRAGLVTILGSGFRRGDSNLDGQVNLADAVATLAHLFAGDAAPGCLDGGDADDSGRVEITDPIFLLGALFLGMQPIPAPHPACGSDGTRDALGCREGCR